VAITAKEVQALRKRTGAGLMDCKKALTEADGNQEEAIKLLKEWGIAKAAKKGGREASEGVLTAVFSDDFKKGALIEVNCETDFVANTDEFKKFAYQVAETIFKKGFSSADELDEEAANQVKGGVTQFGENIVIGTIKKIETSGMLYYYIHVNNNVGTIVAIEGNGNLQQDKIQEMGKDIAVHISANTVLSVSKDDLDAKVLETKKEEFAEEIRKMGKPENMIEKIVEGKMNKFLKDETLLNQPFLKNEDITVEQLVNQVSKETGVDLKVAGFIKTVIGE
jgi:elongation factor Ts